MLAHKLTDEISMQIFESRHAEDLYRVINRNRMYLAEWLPWVGSTNSPNQTKQFIEHSLQQFAANNGFQCGIFYQDQLVGCIGFHHIDWSNKKTSIGYWLAEDYQNQGIMTRSCTAMIQHAFGELHLNRIEIRAGVSNLKSRAIPERLGFTQEGIVRQAEWIEQRCIDHVIYGLLAEEWKVTLQGALAI